MIPLLMTSCVSIQWRDGQGMDHHLGLLAVRTAKGTRGVDYRRYSVGIDLRLSGNEPGVAIGFRKFHGLVPEVVHLKSIRQLGAAVVDYIENPGPLLAPESPSWSLFYFKDDERLSQRTTLLRSTYVGLDVAKATWGGRITAGVSHHNHYVQKSLEDDIVQIFIADIKQPERFQLVLWDLE